MNDSIGDRIKGFYEDRFRVHLPRRTYTLIRVDGKAFHTYTKGLKAPFDEGLIEDMNETAIHLCQNIQGAKLAYVQSDEISIVITDFDELTTDLWFDGNIQKMSSVSASLATSKFNHLRLLRRIFQKDGKTFEIEKFNLANFDSRVFQISGQEEVFNYFIWRQQDATRNSISSVAQSLYSHKELEKKSSNQKQEMIFQKGINWNDYSSREKRGGAIVKINEIWKRQKGNVKDKGVLASAEDFFIGPRGQEITLSLEDPMVKAYTKDSPFEFYKRGKWTVVETPIFTQDRSFLNKYIPCNIEDHYEV